MKKIIEIFLSILLLLIFSLQVILFIQNKRTLKENTSEQFLPNSVNEETALHKEDVEPPRKDMIQTKVVKEEIIKKELVSSGSFSESKTTELTDYAKEEDIKNLEAKVLSLEEEIVLLRTDLKELNETYTQVLITQKSMAVDTTATDSAMDKLRRQAENQYSEKNYGDCFLACKKILSVQPENNDIRLIKVKSLYYKNPLDRSVYEEVLQDIDQLNKSGIKDYELIEIKRNIFAERGIINEE